MPLPPTWGKTYLVSRILSYGIPASVAPTSRPDIPTAPCRFQRLQTVPLASREVEDRVAGVRVYGDGEAAGVVIEVILEVAPDEHDGHRTVGAPVYGHHRAGLDGVEHSLGMVFGRVAQGPCSCAIWEMLSPVLTSRQVFRC